METSGTHPKWFPNIAADRRVAPHLSGYAAVQASFSWDAMRRELLVSAGAQRQELRATERRARGA